MATVFIDGESGTTGLRLRQRLEGHKQVNLLSLPVDLRRDPDARREAMRKAELTVLCLPDDAAREAVVLSEGTGTRILDASSAHRVVDGWTYGMPELFPNQVKLIRDASRVSVPGCHATGMIMLIAPLRHQGLLPRDVSLMVTSFTGYSGGGKNMIATYESSSRTPHDVLALPRPYALEQSHKHLPEVMHYAGLTHAPVFLPVVCDTPCGMLVNVGLDIGNLGLAKQEVVTCLKDTYSSYSTVTVNESDNTLPAMDAMAGRDDIVLSVHGNDERILLSAHYDNLGKGASGTALQCLNVMLGLNPTTGLVLHKNDSLAS